MLGVRPPTVHQVSAIRTDGWLFFYFFKIFWIVTFNILAFILRSVELYCKIFHIQNNFVYKHINHPFASKFVGCINVLKG